MAQNKLNTEIDRALKLLQGYGDGHEVRVSLRDACSAIDSLIALIDALPETKPRKIRTIHHLSCTGGTLFTKCLASMSNVLVLNEVDPYSLMPMAEHGISAFTPTDIVSLLRQGDSEIPNEIFGQVFIASLHAIRDNQASIGRSVILRDHSHSQFLTWDTPSERPTLLETVKREFETLSVVTVRNPIDSYISMLKNGWNTQFYPPTFAEYCRRYLLFLERHEEIPIIKYESLTENPQDTIKYVCKLLDLHFFAGFEDTFQAFRLSGDSGRGGSKIEHKERIEISSYLSEQDLCSDSYLQLKEKLQYEPG